MRRSSGFTLVELVTVLVLVGILSVAIMPRFFNVGEYQARGLYAELKSSLRYAQKSAIAANCPVSVTIVDNTSYSAVYSPACPGAAPGGTPIVGFDGDNVLGGLAGGVVLTSSASPIVFDGAGRTPGPDVTVTVGAGANARAITVRSGTGYVDAP
jgi:MSHA pilin protein MshC